MPSRHAFSLIEALLALGLAGIGVLTLLALMPSALQMPQDSTREEIQTRLLLEAARMAEISSPTERPLTLRFDSLGNRLEKSATRESAAWQVTFDWPSTDAPETRLTLQSLTPTRDASGSLRHYHLLLPPP